MYLKESSLEKQIFVGPFLGPFLTLLTLSIVLFYYAPQHMELPLAGLAGIYCSWKWHVRGTAIAWVLLAAATGLKSVNSPEMSLWWNISLAVSLGLASLITALTQRNISDHLEWKYQDSIEQHSRLAISEARLNTILQTIQQERADVQQQIQTMEMQLKEKTDAQVDYMQFMEIARKELNHTKSENEQLQKEITDCRRALLEADDELKSCKQALSLMQNQSETVQMQNKELTDLRHAVQAYQHQIVSYKDDLRRNQHQQTLILEMSELIETLSREKKLLESTLGSLQEELESTKNKETTDEIGVSKESPRELRRLEGFYRQLREQFEEKTRILDETRQELFHTQENLMRAERELSEKELSSPQISYEEHISHLLKAEAELKQELEQSQQEIIKLNELVETLVSTR